MDDPNQDTRQLRKEEHERGAKLIGGYTAFVAALLIATIAKSDEFRRSWIVISLLAVSLPSLVAWSMLNFTVLVRQGRRGSSSRGLAALMGLLPSLAGIAALLGHFSVIAGTLFVLLTIFWSLCIDVVTFLGSKSPESKI